MGDLNGPHASPRATSPSIRLQLDTVSDASITRLRPAFELYCGAGQDTIDSTGFMKICRDGAIIDREVDADLVFASVVPLGQRRIDVRRFALALEELARRRHMRFDVVCDSIQKCPGRPYSRLEDDRAGHRAESPCRSSGMRSRSSSPLRRRGFSPGPAAYTPVQPRPAIKGGSYFGTRHTPDVHLWCASGVSSIHPGVCMKPFYGTESTRGGNYFGTSHRFTLRGDNPYVPTGLQVASGRPGPGAY